MGLLRTFVFILSVIASTFPSFGIGENVPEPGMRYRVNNVGEGDQLNVRVGPSADAHVVGTLVPGSGDLEVTGRWEAGGSSVWWEILIAGGNRGWVNARYLAPESSHPFAESNYPLDCGGTEPFWSLLLKDGRARYWFGSPDSRATFSASDWVPADAYAIGVNFVIRLIDSGGREGLLVAIHSAGLCSDDMSEVGYPFYATLVLSNGEVHGGCCSRTAH